MRRVMLFVFLTGCDIAPQEPIGTAVELNAPASLPTVAHVPFAPPICPPPTMCPAPTVCAASAKLNRVRIMPLGDSITEGLSSFVGGYRTPLWHLLWDRDDKFSFVGSMLSNGVGYPQPFPEIWHEGHGGFEIGALGSGIVGGWLINNPADVVLIFAGTNDCLHLHEYGMLDRMAALVAAVQATGAHPIVGELHTVTNGQCGIDFNNALPMLGVQIAKTNVLLAEDLVDGIHPNGVGMAKLATAWDAAINDYLHPVTP